MTDVPRADTGAVVGYARVSTVDEDVTPQTSMLKSAGCSRLFVDVASGALTPRPQLDAAIESLGRGDRLVVCRLDRMGRSLRHLVTTVDMLRNRGIELQSIEEDLDTASPEGADVARVFDALADFKRGLLQERAAAGLAVARASGRTGGRKPALSPETADLARDMFESGEHTVAEVAAALGVSRATIYRIVKAPRAHSHHFPSAASDS